MKYVIITPIKNEEKFIRYTLDSICAQTLIPTEWIIVDDGSSDNSADIVKEYVLKYSWIKYIKFELIGKREIGGRVVQVFNYGLQYLSTIDYNFIVKLDGDLTLPENYFQRIAEELKNNISIGVIGGVIGMLAENKIVIEKSADYHVRGAFKAYSSNCFNKIGGLRPLMGWDGLDEFLAMYNGFEVKVLKELVVIHHRVTGTETGQLNYSKKIGKYCYDFGYDPLLTFFRAVKDGLSRKPYVLSGGYLFFFYCIYLFKGKEKLIEPSIRKYIRKFQYNRIFNLLTHL